MRSPHLQESSAIDDTSRAVGGPLVLELRVLVVDAGVCKEGVAVLEVVGWVGAGWVDELGAVVGERVCMCVYVCACVWQWWEVV